ncbi:hypothetical protein DAEQUDRAFT_760642 [Daedalea quercina L-15889]|uniref:Fungal-type protein kinase domain-containing protein n=1 Tax=Daedalea quercina L-15889 TaxID=1314783 RepID=A0A165KGE9_9APHY|nr:hypothetical protein DAEQUDRAFT_760642 [Daedalea quercina L-15889]
MPTPPPEGTNVPQKIPGSPAGHRTISGWYLAKRNHRFYDRSHTRLAIDTLGTYELAIALRDAIEGHKRAYEAGILHRDISKGDIMISRHQDGTYGFIQDFDCAFSWFHFLRRRGWQGTLASWEHYIQMNEGHQDLQLKAQAADIAAQRDRMRDRKERTLQGTLHFMAVEILMRSDITHEVRHDLESFFWLLTWMLLRHAKHEHVDGIHACQELFGGEKGKQCGVKRLWWLAEPKVLTIENHAPLNHLLKEFRRLCRENQFKDSLPEHPMTHDQVLRIFNDALAMEGWPEDDAAHEYQRPYNAKDQEELDALGTLRETSSLEPSGEVPILHTSSMILTLEEPEPDQDVDEDEATKASPQAKPPQKNTRERYSHVSFGLSSYGDDSSDGDVPDRCHRRNTSRAAGNSSIASSSRRGRHASRSTQGEGRGGSLSPGPSFGGGRTTTEASTKTRSVPRAVPMPQVPSMMRTRSQTRLGAPTSSRSRATKRTYSDENDGESRSDAAKRPRHPSPSPSRSPGRNKSRKGKGKQKLRS